MKRNLLSLSCLISAYALLCHSPVLAAPQNEPATDQINNSTSESEDIGIVSFTPPNGWHFTDTASLPKSVKIMVVGKGQKPFPPSMNLSTEPYKKSLKQYLKVVKSINDAHGYEWKDLGMIQTEAGPANLSQVDTKSEWGDVRMMHVILLKNNYIYILTASALKEEFSNFYKDFFNAMKSLKVSKDFFETLPPQKRSQLKLAYDQVLNQWQTLFNQKHQQMPETSTDEINRLLFADEEFQRTVWNPYQDTIHQKFADMGAEWQSFVLQKTEADLLSKNR